jgi:polysaccharide pyruvyl transferase WcaK-like protein
MDPSLARLVSRYCRDALVITRNTESRTVLSKLGVPTRLGTDTAWTFDPAPASVGRKMLSDAGWDGQTPVLAVCPINPFWWPVRPDIGKAVAHWSGGMHADAHYKSIYFHHAGSDVDEKQDTYLRAIATAVNRFRAEQDVFVVCVGMEQLDRKACSALSPMIDDAPLFISDEYDMYEMVSLLRQCGMLVSSRYHAIVTSMPGGVPSAGITMDERIRNLMRDRNQPELALEVDSPDLAEELLVVLRKLHAEGPEISEGIARCVHLNLERMGVMGQILVDYLREQLPGLPLRPELGEHGNPWHHLPPLSDELQRQIAQVSA